MSSSSPELLPHAQNVREALLPADPPSCPRNAMADKHKSYFLPPRWIYEPTNSPIFLGSVIANASQPQNSLNPTDQASPRTLTLDKPRADFDITIDNRKGLSAGVTTDLLSALGVGPGASISGERSKHASYRITTTSTTFQEFHASPTIVDSVVQQPDIQLYLRQTNFKKDIYMITGLMVAENACITTDEGRGSGTSSKIGLGGATIGLPGGELGVHFENSKTTSTSASFNAADGPIIIGYQLSRISWIKRKRLFKTEALLKGAVMSSDGNVEEVEQSAQDRAEYYAWGEKLDIDVVGAEEFDMMSVAAESSDGLVFELAVPEAEEVQETELGVAGVSSSASR